MGERVRFDFERLTYIYSSTLFLWGLETLIQKGVFYFLNIGNPSFCDVTAFTGYKFVVLSPIAATEILVGYYGSYAVMIVTGALYSLFFYKTLGRYNLQNTLA